MMQSVLKLPHWIEIEELDKELNDDREAGDGNSGQPDSDFDEFSSQESDNDSTSHSVIPSANYAAVPSIGKCRVLYTYAANMYDELSIQPGDILNIHDKRMKLYIFEISIRPRCFTINQSLVQFW